MAKVKIEGIEPLRTELKKRSESFFEPDFLYKLGATVVFKERQRTQEGLDIHGKPFADYSPWYAEYRRSRGRQAEHVDLLFSGRMLNSLAADVLDSPGGSHEVVVNFRALERLSGVSVGPLNGPRPRRGRKRARTFPKFLVRMIGTPARHRPRGGNFSPVADGKTRDKVGEAVGMSGRTY